MVGVIEDGVEVGHDPLRVEQVVAEQRRAGPRVIGRRCAVAGQDGVAPLDLLLDIRHVVVVRRGDPAPDLVGPLDVDLQAGIETGVVDAVYGIPVLDEVGHLSFT